jgi:hypothetical protein
MSDVYRAPTGATESAFAPGSDSGTYDEAAGSGWVTFAGVMIAIVGTMNIIYGIAAIDNANFYARDVNYVISSLNTWGWILLVVGAIQVLVAFGIWAGNQFARWLGVLVASVNAIVQLIFLPAYPFLALALFSLDLLVVFGLVAYGGRRVTV